VDEELHRKAWELLKGRYDVFSNLSDAGHPMLSMTPYRGSSGPSGVVTQGVNKNKNKQALLR